MHIGEITATYNPDTNTVVFFNADTGEDVDTIIYRNQTPEEIEAYMTSESGLGLKKNEDEEVRDDGKELLLGAEEDDRDFTIEKIDSDKIKELADKSALTWEGAVITDEALQKIVDDFKDKTDINLPVKFYTYTGRQMNDMYGLTEKNAYKDDLHFLSVDLDNWNNIDNLPMFKMKAKARWLDDIVDGNADAQKIIDNK